MVENFCSFFKDTLNLKVPKMSPLILRMTILVIATVCGVYMCSVCLKQINSQTNSTIEVIGRPDGCCEADNLESPYLHYPQPETFSRAECAENPVRFFVIISMQRSGSGWFETLLNSHMNISSNGEIFSYNDRRDNISSIIRTLDRVYNLDWFNSASKNECSAAVGLKWMLNQAEALSNYKPLINSTSIISDLKEAEFTMAQALAYFNSTRHIILYYEDLIQNRSKLMDVQDFLRIPRMNLTSRQVKIHKGALREHIKNWEDVNKTLNGTVYEKYLHLDY
ncbi:Nodulation protein H [Bienertia sinuspersici]